ncbi:hypothetical protein [Amycolatopsis sp. NPDC059021]|uniref:hypothetical protein n=1 Tax=Amycolatopsis sp. NPDC059021 TaxID=3346704 RepID=UPI003670C003
MRVYRCLTDEDDYIGIATTAGGVLLTVHETRTTAGQPATAEHEISADDARALADKIRAVLAGEDKAGETCGMYVGLRPGEATGLLVSVGLDTGATACVILSREDAAGLADRLTLAGAELPADTAPATDPGEFPDLARRAAALRITATTFDVAEVDLYDAAEWVAAEPAA